MDYLTTLSRLLTILKEKPFENIVEKEENAGNQHFLLSPQCFLPNERHIKTFELDLFCCLQMLSISLSPKFGHFVKS